MILICLIACTLIFQIVKQLMHAQPGDHSNGQCMVLNYLIGIYGRLIFTSVKLLEYNFKNIHVNFY